MLKIYSESEYSNILDKTKPTISIKDYQGRRLTYFYDLLGNEMYLDIINNKTGKREVPRPIAILELI
jgi:hypothetical protein